MPGRQPVMFTEETADYLLGGAREAKDNAPRPRYGGGQRGGRPATVLRWLEVRGLPTVTASQTRWSAWMCDFDTDTGGLVTANGSGDYSYTVFDPSQQLASGSLPIGTRVFCRAVAQPSSYLGRGSRWEIIYIPTHNSPWRIKAWPKGTAGTEITIGYGSSFLSTVSGTIGDYMNATPDLGLTGDILMYVPQWINSARLAIGTAIEADYNIHDGLWVLSTWTPCPEMCLAQVNTAGGVLVGSATFSGLISAILLPQNYDAAGLGSPVTVTKTITTTATIPMGDTVLIVWNKSQARWELASRA